MSSNQPISRTDTETLEVYQVGAYTRVDAKLESLPSLRTDDGARSPHSCGDYATVSYRDAAIALWGDAGAYAHDAYARLREQLYPELAEQLPISIGLSAYGHCVGETMTWAYGTRIFIFSPLFHRGRRRVDDVLAHEMLHAWLHVTGQDAGHDSDAWYAGVRRLSPLVLGHELEVKRGADRKSVRVPNPNYEPGNGKPKTLVRKVRAGDAVPHGDVAGWPDSFRPADYDWGKAIPCPTY